MLNVIITLFALLGLGTVVAIGVSYSLHKLEEVRVERSLPPL